MEVGERGEGWAWGLREKRNGITKGVRNADGRGGKRFTLLTFLAVL